MKESLPFFLLFAVFWLLQGAAMFYQQRVLKKKIMDLKQKGDLVIGVNKTRLGSRIYSFLVFNNGIVDIAEIYKGLTIFSKFKPLTEIINQDINTLHGRQEIFGDDNHKIAIELSVRDAVEKYWEKYKK
jgi:DNA-binding transcriptional regulator of glucitol operon